MGSNNENVTAKSAKSAKHQSKMSRKGSKINSIAIFSSSVGILYLSK
jgi:hypothetical protein